MPMKNKPGTPCGCCQETCLRECSPTAYALNWTVSSPLSTYLSDVVLSGVTTANSTSGTLWVRVILNPSFGVAVGVYIYKNGSTSNPANRVAKFESAGVVIGGITFTELNSSGISGTATFSTPASDQSGTLTGDQACRFVVNGNNVLQVKYRLLAIDDPFILTGVDGVGTETMTINGTSALVGDYLLTIGTEICGECFHKYLWYETFPGSGDFTRSNTNPGVFYPYPTGPVQLGVDFYAATAIQPIPTGTWAPIWNFTGGGEFLSFAIAWNPETCLQLPSTVFSGWSDYIGPTLWSTSNGFTAAIEHVLV